MARTALIDRGFNFGTDEVTGKQEIAIFDSVISEAPSFEIAVTDNPVDTGVSLADHAYAKPDTITMEVAVSDTPLLSDGKGTPSYKLATTWLGASAVDSNGEALVRRSINAWQYIMAKAKAFAIFDVQIGLGLYQNMMFISGSARQDKDTAGELIASIKLQQVKFAVTASVLYPPRGPKKTQKNAAPKTDGGKKEPQPAPIKKPPSTLSGILGVKG